MIKRKEIALLIVKKLTKEKEQLKALFLKSQKEIGQKLRLKTKLNTES